MKMRKCLLAALLVGVSSLSTGCWDRIEIEERGTILALAIDPLSDPAKENLTGQQAKSDIPGYRLTAQVAIPGRIPLGPSEGSGGGASHKPVWLVSATGKTIDDAMNTLQMELAEQIFLGHLRIIIVNQTLAETTGVHEILDFLRRNAEIRRLAWLLVSKGEALQTMEASPKLERLPTLYLVSTMDHAVELGKIPNVFLGNFLTALSSKGEEPVLPYISVRGTDQIKMEGLAAFKGDKMISSLSALEVAAYMELRDERRAGYAISVPMPGDPAHSVTIKGTGRRTKIRMHRQGGKPVFDVYSRIEANIEEKTGRQPVDAVFDKLTAEASTALMQGQEKVLKKMQGLRADVFGFGEYVRGKDPTYWATIKTLEKWDDAFSQLPVRLHCRVFIRRSGVSAH